MLLLPTHIKTKQIQSLNLKYTAVKHCDRIRIEYVHQTFFIPQAQQCKKVLHVNRIEIKV